MSTATKEHLKELTARIRLMEHAAHDDCEMYQREADGQTRRRLRRLDDETWELRKQVDNLMRLLSQSEMLRPIVVETTEQN